MHGHGVAANTKLAWEYFARANFGSRHARLSRAEGATLRLAKGVYEARAHGLSAVGLHPSRAASPATRRFRGPPAPRWLGAERSALAAWLER